MKSKITKIQILKKGILLVLMIALMLPSSIYALEGLTLQESTTLEKLIYGEVGSVVRKIEEHFKSNTTLYIVNEIQFRAFAEYVNSGNSCQGKVIQLLNDVNLDTDTDWMPIGNSYSEFSGTFDGNGYSIKNLTYKCRENYQTEGGYYNIGLFGVISKHGKVQNIKIDNSNIEANGLDTDEILYVGNIAGTNYGKILDCSANKMPLEKTQINEGTEDNNYVGLLVGRNNGDITISAETEPSISKDSSEIDINLNVYRKQGENYTKITDFLNENNFKIGETIRLEFIIDQYLYTGLEDGQEIKLADKLDEEGNVTEEVLKENYPLVTMGNNKTVPLSSIQEEIELEDGSTKPQTTLVYEYTVIAEEQNKVNNASIDINFEKNFNDENLYVYNSESAENFYTGDRLTGEVKCSDFKINLDSEIPSVEIEAYVEELSNSYRYSEGKEIIIKVESTEKIQATVAPELRISFSESGLGKYNYKENSTKGNAVHIDALLDGRGRTTWIYSYIIQPGDEGTLNIEYISGIISDSVGNTKDISEIEIIRIYDIYADTTAPIVTITPEIENSITNKDTITYKFNWSERISEFTQENITVINGSITKLEKIDNNIKNEVDLNKDGKIDSEDLQTLRNYLLNGKCTVSYREKYDTNSDEKVNIDDLNKLRNALNLYDFNKDGKFNSQDIEIVVNYSLNNQEYNEEYDIDGSGKITATDAVKLRNYRIKCDLNESGDIDSEDINLLSEYISEGKLKGKFIGEYVKEYDFDLNGRLSTSDLDMLKSYIANMEAGRMYQAEISTTIENGNVGDLQVIVEQDACQDLAGHGNVRTESIIRVDRKAPIIQSLEAYVESSIKLNSEVDVIKEYYKTGEIIKVVATFDENVVAEKVPELVLQFSESKNSVVPEGTIEGNKITYTYTIAEGDEGTVAVRALSGSVTDAAGNETKVTRKNLDGNNIIVDTKAPSMKELNVTTSEGTYNAGKTITIEAIYDENVYALNDNEIKNISAELAPTLKVKFGNGEEREATFAGYVGEDKTRLEYTVSIVEEDNGVLSITSYDNKENVNVCDIAGNTAELNNKQTGNEIIADNIRPVVESIEAKVEYPSISGTDIYYKEGNTVKITLTFSEEVSSNKLWPEILVGFSEEAGKEPAEYNTYAYESDWNVNSKTIEYSYTIRNGENGYLWVKVPEAQFRDAAGNTNIAKDAEEKSNVFADTIIPTVTLYRDTEETQNNQTITIKATFNENVYDLDGDRRITLTTANAPKLIYSFGDGANKEIGATSINGAIITYTITKDAVEDNGDLHYELAKGNLCDRAGNELYKTTLDTTAPVLESVRITSNAGILYNPYCKEGKEIYVIATFNEPIKAENIKLKAKVGEAEIAEHLDGEIVEENETKVKFTYTVKAGDMGEFKILDICGETDSKITEENADNTYGWVQDEHGNQNNIYSLEDEKVTPSGKAEADTKDPYITSIKAKVDGEEIATYTKEDGKDAVISVGRTNENIVEYIVTYSEKVQNIDKSKILIQNGIIKSIEYTEFALNEFKITVQTTVEGVQSLIINEGTVEDKAGNTDEFVRLNAVTVDFTKPTVRFISEYNGGAYVLPTNIDKVEIRPNVEISEDIAKVEYKWDNEEYVEIQNYSSSSDIAVPTKAFTEYGQYKLFIKVVDLAGNVSETSKTYEILNSYIGISADITECTNKDVTVTVSFGEGLTDNRKVTFKAEGSNEVVELNAKGTNQNGTEYTIGTNGTIYAEATDRIGNKVFIEHTIYNIDKENPIVELSLNGANLVIGTEKEKATIKSTVKVEDANLKEIKYIYSNNEEITAEEKATMKSIDNYGEAKTDDAVEGTYYLHVLAIDEAGNETMCDSLEFKVVNSNTLKDEEGNITFTPADENTIKFERQQQFVYVTYGWNLSENQEITFTNEDDGYDLDGYAQVLKPTTVTAKAEDVCGNIVTATYVVESVEGPKFDVIGNPKDWTNQDVKLEVSTYDALSALTVNGTDILSKEDGVRSNIVVTQNGDYEFVATDIYGNISKQTIKVEKIDKELPVISKVENEGKDITITATDAISGVKEYAITSTTEVPLEWSESNVIKTTKDGVFYAWAKDAAGNISRTEDVIVVDTTAPTITFNYTSLTVTVGVPLETNIVTNEDAIISYSWDNETWVDSTELLTSLKVSEKSTTTGKYTLYVKAKDGSGNESKVQTLEFNVTKEIEDIKVPEIIFEDLPTIQVNGVQYVKVAADMTSENITEKMNKEALLGKTPEYTKLTEDKNLKTGSEITIDGDTKYIIVVNGDVNCDGNVEAIDVTFANRVRLGKVNSSIIQKLAADFDLNGKVEAIDITMINRYRLGKIKGI